VSSAKPSSSWSVIAGQSKPLQSLSTPSQRSGDAAGLIAGSASLQSVPPEAAVPAKPSPSR